MILQIHLKYISYEKFFASTDSCTHDLVIHVFFPGPDPMNKSV